VTRALALLLVLTACGGGGGSSGDAKDAKDAKDGKDTPPPPPRTRFRYTCAEKQVFDALVAAVRDLGVAPVGTGVFGAHMDVSLVNDGPVTIVVDTP
jgi:hypothetical protein